MSVVPYDPMKGKLKRLAGALLAAVLIVLIVYFAGKAWQLAAGFVRGLAQLVGRMLL